VPRSDADLYHGILERRKRTINRHRSCRKASGISSHRYQRRRAVGTLQGLMLACEHRPLWNNPRASRLTLGRRPNAGEVPPLTTKIMQSAKPHGKKTEASYLQRPTPQGLVTFVEKGRRRRLSILRISSTVFRFISGLVRLRIPS